MKKLEMLYSGKAKMVFKTDDPDVYVIEYRDDATAFNGQKKGSYENKGILNNKIANIIFKEIEKHNVPTHLIEEISDRETVVKKVEIIPLEVIIRNVAAGSFSKRYGVPEGTALKCTILEFSYKNDELNDPLINDYHAMALSIATREELDEISKMAFKINEIITEIFKKINLRLIDFKIEFGKTSDGKIILADEISPDTCRLWEIGTDEKMDKDRFRRDMGGFMEAYNEVYKRLSETAF